MADLTEEEELTKQTYDSQAVSWSAQHLDRNFWLKEMEAFQKYLPKGRLLEVGCGGGRDARELIERDYEYLGTDISANLLQQAQQVNPGAEFKEVSLYDLHFDQSFDGFWCAAVLLHIPKVRIDEALAAIKKSIKKGGIGFIAIKQGKGEKVEDDSGFYKGKRLFVYWQANEFRAVLEQNGYTILEQGTKSHNETTWLTYIVQTS